MAFRAGESRYHALAAQPLERRLTAARAATSVLAVTVLAGVLAVAIAGGWLVAFDPITPVTVIGAILIAVAVALRPRLGRLDRSAADAERVGADEAPRLFGLIRRVGEAIGAPLPHVVLIGESYEARVATVGFRRRRVLSLGAALWATLAPQEKVALLGRELGEFIAGDLRRGVLTGSAEGSLGTATYLLAPPRGLPEHTRPPSAGVFMSAVSDVLVTGIGGTLARLVYLLHLALARVAGIDSQRAAYRADELAATVAGTAGAVGLVDRLLLHDAIDTVVCREARARRGAPAWRAAAVTARENMAPQLPLHRQLSRRWDISLLFKHPPLGLRARMLLHRPARPALVRLSEAESASIDTELTLRYERARIHLAHRI